MKVFLLMIVLFEYSFCFEKLMENIRKIHDHQDEELLQYEGEEYMLQVNQFSLSYSLLDIHSLWIAEWTPALVDG